MAPFGIDFGDFNLTDPGGGSALNLGDFNLTNAGGSGIDFGNFNLGQGFDVGRYAGPASSSGFDLGDYGGGTSGTGGTSLKDILGYANQFGNLGKFGYEGILGAIRTKQMGDYNKAVQDYYNSQKAYTQQQQDYLKQKQAWESQFMGQFNEAQGAFAEETAGFEDQIAGAQAQAQGVLDQFRGTATTLLGQSQDLLVPAIAALAKGEVPESLKPVLDQARQRATATAMQGMISAGMSPEQARANATPMIDQQISAMLSQMATAMSTQGLAIGKQGMEGLQGAGTMADVLGKLASAGFSPLAQEFANMLQVAGSILGGQVQGTQLPPPPAPVA